MVQGRSSDGLPSAARLRAFRSGFVPLNAPLRPPLHFPRSPMQIKASTVFLMLGLAQFSLSIA